MAITKATLGRLPDYLRVLESEELKNSPTVSATVIAKMLNLGEVQVRKDLNAVSGAGKPKTGYDTSALIARLEETLGIDTKTYAVIVGAGKLGSALLDYSGFVEYGVEIIAGFDVDVSRCNEKIHGKNVYPMSEFSRFINENGVEIGIIAVPKSAAQQVCDIMVKSGIKAIWNFAPQTLTVPNGVLLQQENLALSVAFLNSQLKNK